MSGGHFDYKQYLIGDIAEEIERVISSNKDRNYPYTPETIEQFEKAVEVLRTAKIYAQRIDWLLSCDEGQDQFHQRLEEELKERNETSCP